MSNRTPFTILAVTASLLAITHTLPAQQPAARAATAQAMANARILGLALLEFDQEYGRYPSDITRPQVEERTGVKIPEDQKSANALFRQLFFAEILHTEKPFFARITGVQKPDDNIQPGQALAPGENAFTYISGLSTARTPNTPVILCPVIPGTTTFDPAPFGGKAIIMYVDLSVRVHDIENDGRVLVDGADILSPDHPVWDGTPPDIHHPELHLKEQE